MLVKCQNCAGKVSDTASACPHCKIPPDGYLGETRQCAECGGNLRAAYGHCLNCGAPSDTTASKYAQAGIQSSTIAMSPPSAASTHANDSVPFRASVRPLTTTWEWLRWTMLFFLAARSVVAVELVIAIALWNQIDNNAPDSYQNFQTYSNLVLSWDQTLIALSLGGFLAAAVCYCFFVHRALSRLTSLGAPHVTLSPAWGTWSAIVPIATWFVPFVALRQIWRGTMARAGLSIATPFSMMLWWAAWLSVSVLSTVSGYAERAAEQASGYAATELWRMSTYVTLAGCIAFILAGICLLRNTRKIVNAWGSS